MNLGRKLKLYYDTLQESLRNPVKTRSEGSLDTETGLVCIEKQRGKALFRVGFHRNQRQYLFPEETICLAHRGVLDVYLNETLLSLEDTYQHVYPFVARECMEAYCYLREKKFFPKRCTSIFEKENLVPRVSGANDLFFAYEVHGPKTTATDQNGLKKKSLLFRVVVLNTDSNVPRIGLLQRALARSDSPVKLLVVDSEGGVLPFEMSQRIAITEEC